MSPYDWKLATAIWKRDGWEIAESPHLYGLCGPDGCEDVEGRRILLVRGGTSVVAWADTEKHARMKAWALMEGV
jgi:hypothetical protein